MTVAGVRWTLSLIGVNFPIELVSRGDQIIDRRRFEKPLHIARPIGSASLL
jgi:hypothetical protein